MRCTIKYRIYLRDIKLLILMASSYAPPSNDISNNPYSGTPPSDEFGNPMDYDYKFLAMVHMARIMDAMGGGYGGYDMAIWDMDMGPPSDEYGNPMDMGIMDYGDHGI